MCKEKPHYRDMTKYLGDKYIETICSPPLPNNYGLVSIQLAIKGLKPTLDRIFNYKFDDEPNESDMEFQQFIIDNYNKTHNINEKDNNNE